MSNQYKTLMHRKSLKKKSYMTPPPQLKPMGNYPFEQKPWPSHIWLGIKGDATVTLRSWERRITHRELNFQEYASACRKYGAPVDLLNIVVLVNRY